MDRDDRKEAIATMHRDNIVKAAQELFVENGYEKTTMDDISKKAQYSKRTVYIYFESKDEIYSYFVIKGYELLKEKLTAALSGSSDIIEQYHSLCNALVAFKSETPEYFNGIVSSRKYESTAASGGETEKKLVAAGSEIYKILSSFLSEAQEEGIVLQQIDLRKTVHIIWSGMLCALTEADAKGDYIRTVLGTEPEEYRSFSFMLLLNAVLDPGN